MEDLVGVVLLTAILPGALVGLLWGFRRGAMHALISALIGGVAGFAGAIGLTQLMLGPFWSGPWPVAAGSVLGAVVVLFVFGLFRGTART